MEIKVQHTKHKINPNSANHSRNAVIALRRYIIKDITKGRSHNEIVQKIMEDGYGIGKGYGKSTAERYILDAKKVLKQNWQRDLPEFREKIASCYWDIVADARENGDRQAAIKALIEVGKLAGIYETRNVNLQHNGNITIDFGFDENTDTENDNEEMENEVEDERQI